MMDSETHISALPKEIQSKERLEKQQLIVSFLLSIKTSKHPLLNLTYRKIDQKF